MSCPGSSSPISAALEAHGGVTPPRSTLCGTRLARKLYADEELSVKLGQTAYAFDSTTIDLCLSLFPWARFRRHKAAIKHHTLMDLRGSIPSFIRITEGKTHDVNILDELIMEPGAFYVMDRAYIDFGRLHAFSYKQNLYVNDCKQLLLSDF